MSRSKWTIGVSLDKGGREIKKFEWCPQDDPIESPMQAYTRAGNILFTQQGYVPVVKFLVL